MTKDLPFRRSWNKFFVQIKTPIFFAAVFISCLMILFLVKQIFSISIIKINKSDSLKGLDKLNKKMIFFISIAKEEKSLYKLNPNLDSIKITKQYPNQLLITINKAQPQAALKTDKGFFYLSLAGRIMLKKKDNDFRLPIINYYQLFHSDEYQTGILLTNKDILFSLFFIQKINLSGVQINSVDINSWDMLVLKTEDKNYFFTAEKDKDLQYDEWSQVVHRLKIEGVNYKVLDLRFNKPIIKIGN